ncbi:hypothetical protein [Deinococcus sp. UR1]|uniref:hypothetical protein n=1 Tax=Deinococcus sp. UR1 TaxID=1704277 RepID=UPI0011AF5215|nr:hypothetical protein [Deinococcus sp. UR1]
MTKKRGRPKIVPRRVTVSLAQHHADELQRLASEADVTLSALCAHVLERYAVQDRELMTNDVLAQRLAVVQEAYLAEFTNRFGDVLLRQAHEIVALRRQMLAVLGVETSTENARKMQDDTWQAAVRSLRPYTQKIRSRYDAGETTGSEIDS